MRIMPDHQIHKIKPPTFNSDVTQAGQGDSFYYHDAYRQFAPFPGHFGGQVKPEIAKSRSVPFLGAGSAVIDAQKYATSFTQATTDYLSESSDLSSFTSATRSSINSFKSANELVCSRSDVSLASERLADSFVIGKG